MPMYQGGNKISAAYANSGEEQCPAVVNGVEVYSCGDDTEPPTPPEAGIWRVKTTLLDEVFYIPLQNGYVYDFNVDWGDGSPIDTIQSWDDPALNHTYEIAGEYLVTIVGSMPYFRFFDDQDNAFRLIGVLQWGQLGFTNGNGMFGNCRNCIWTAPTYNATENITDMTAMFQTNEQGLPDMSLFTTANVTSMNSTFRGAQGTGAETIDLTNFDTSNVTDMTSMCQDQGGYTTVDMTGCDTGNVLSFRTFFLNTNIANFPGFYQLDISAATDIGAMFWGTSISFTDPTPRVFSSALLADEMFSSIQLGVTVNLSNWSFPVCWHFGLMFANSLGTLIVAGMDVSAGTNFNFTFANIADNPDVSGLDVSSATTMTAMFQGASSCNPDVSTWIISDVTLMSSMMLNSAFSNANFDAALLNFAGQSPGIQSNVPWHAGTAQYTETAAFATLDPGASWTITSGGEVP